MWLQIQKSMISYPCIDTKACQFFIIVKLPILKRPNQDLNTSFGATSERKWGTATASPADRQNQNQLFGSELSHSDGLLCKIVSGFTCHCCSSSEVEEKQTEKQILPQMSMLGWCVDGEKKGERCTSGAEIAVVYSSANPKFCAKPMVARKQLTVKWGGSKGLVCPVWAQNSNPSTFFTASPFYSFTHLVQCFAWPAKQNQSLWEFPLRIKEKKSIKRSQIQFWIIINREGRWRFYSCVPKIPLPWHKWTRQNKDILSEG